VVRFLEVLREIEDCLWDLVTGRDDDLLIGLSCTMKNKNPE
jgi:hypothetical protein